MAHLAPPRLPRGALGIVGAIAVAGLIIVACGAPQVTTEVPTAPVPTEVAAASPTLLPTDTLPPLAPTETSSLPAPSPSAAPTNPPPTDTPTSLPPAADTATSTPAATDTPVPPTATPVPTRRPTNTPAITYPAATLLAPQEQDANLVRGRVTFRWSYPRALRPNEAFQVLMWKEGNPHWGAAELWTDTQQTINLNVVLPQRGGDGVYSWTVVVREKGTEKQLSPEAPPWRLGYGVLIDPCSACDCQAECRSGNCHACCEQCCSGCQ